MKYNNKTTWYNGSTKRTATSNSGWCWKGISENARSWLILECREGLLRLIDLITFGGPSYWPTTCIWPLTFPPTTILQTEWCIACIHYPHILFWFAGTCRWQCPNQVSRYWKQWSRRLNYPLEPMGTVELCYHFPIVIGNWGGESMAEHLSLEWITGLVFLPTSYIVKKLYLKRE